MKATMKATTSDLNVSMDHKPSEAETQHIDNVQMGNVAERDSDTQLSIEEGGSIETSNKRLLRKIDWRLLPLCGFLYLLNYLDRSNLGNGKVLNSETGDSLLQRTGMDENGYAITLTLFSIAYTVFEIPSNWILKRYSRPSYWLGTLLFCWGAITLGFAGVNNLATAVVLRFLIGVFEAGFFPGLVYLVTFWYRAEERSVRIAFILATATLAGAFGGCIAYGTGFLNRKGGLEGFRWLFVFEGAVTILTTPLVIFTLPNYPSTAKWLTAREQKFAVERLNEQNAGFSREPASRDEIKETLCSPRMLVHYLAYLTNNIVMSSFTYFSPTLVSGMGYTSIQAQLMTVPPWAVGYVVSLLLAWSADRFNARGLHIFVAASLTGVGFLVSSILPTDANVQRYGCLILASCGAFPSAAPLTAWVTCNVPSSKTVGLAVAANNSMVGLASLVALWVWRPEEEETGYPTGNIICAVSGFATALLSLGMWVYYQRMNRRIRSAVADVRVWAL